jgi:nucleotide-binding universal stress UspA family protein
MSGWDGEENEMTAPEQADRPIMTGHGDHGSVVVGVDGSAGGARAAEWAAEEAVVRDVPLTVVGVAEGGAVGPDRELRTRMQRTVDASVASLVARHPGLVVEGQARAGIAAEELLQVSASADLVVVGSRGLGGFTGLLLGSVGQHVLTHARSSVAIVRERDDDATADGGPRPVVVGVDDSPGSGLALDVAVTEAARHQVPLEIVGSAVFPGAAGYVVAAGVAVEDAARVAVDRALARAREGSPSSVIRGRVVDDPPALSLAMASRRASLVVVGSRGLGAFRGLLLGSVSQTLAIHAACTLLVVREPVTEGPDADA